MQHPEQEPQPAAQDAAATPAGSQEALAAAAGRSALGRALEQEKASDAVLVQIGGWRGLVEAVLPGLAFLVAYAVTKEVAPAVIAPLVLGLLFFIVRLLQRSPSSSALGGLLGMGLSAVLVLFTGRGEDFFLFGFVVNVVSCLLLLGSMLLRWPALGILIAVLAGKDSSWRTEWRMMRTAQWLTGMWLLVFALRLLVQLPLYFAAQVEALALAKLLMGWPLAVPAVVVTWLVARAVLPKQQDEAAVAPDA